MPPIGTRSVTASTIGGRIRTSRFDDESGRCSGFGFAFMVDGAPEIAELAVDLHKDLIQKPAPRPGPQSFQSGAAPRHPADLQAETHGRIGGVARPYGVVPCLRKSLSRHASADRRYSDDAALRLMPSFSTASRTRSRKS